MPSRTLQAFTGSANPPAAGDYFVGYASANPGGERKWLFSCLANYVKQALGNQPWQPTAWVTFNGAVGIGSNATIHSSYNISSVTRTSDATGCNTVVSRYIVNFASNLMNNANYAVLGTAQVGSYANNSDETNTNDQVVGVYSKATNTVQNCIVSVFDANARGGTAQTSQFVSLVFFGGKS